MPTVCVRIGHVLGGADDFTGRLAAHVRLAQSGTPLTCASTAGTSWFIDADSIADFLRWVGQQTFTGAVNASCEVSPFAGFYALGAIFEYLNVAYFAVVLAVAGIATRRARGSAGMDAASRWHGIAGVRSRDGDRLKPSRDERARWIRKTHRRDARATS